MRTNIFIMNVFKASQLPLPPSYWHKKLEHTLSVVLALTVSPDASCMRARLLYKEGRHLAAWAERLFFD